MSDHQFTKRRVYPALVSFWNQFQHELERLLGGLGYGISFDLDIPELTEREKARAEIARIRGEALVNLISAGASGPAAVKALELPDTWLAAAEGIYSKGLVNELNAPINIDYEKPKAIESTVDKKEDESQPTDPLENLETHDNHKTCTCHHSLDQLPPMTKQEREIYDILVKLGESLIKAQGKDIELDEIIAEMTNLLKKDATYGAINGAQALKLLSSKEIAQEILKSIKEKTISVSNTLVERLASRAGSLVKGYSELTKGKVLEVLNSEEELSASQIKTRLSQVLSREKAELIARNETLYAIRSGRLEQDELLAEKYGLNVKLVWRTSGDSDVCDVCAAMEGQTVEIGKAFSDSVKTADGETVSWEHSSWNDNGRIPDAHVNCRCYFDEVIE